MGWVPEIWTAQGGLRVEKSVVLVVMVMLAAKRRGRGRGEGQVRGKAKTGLLLRNLN